MKTSEKTIAKSELNNVLNEEYKSFSMLCKVLTAKKSSVSMKAFLNQYDLKFEQLIDINYLKNGLNVATFTASDGVTTFETICRKNKDGETVPAKWSFWLILTAAAKVRKEEIKGAQKAVWLAKEASLKALKEAKESEKKAIKEEKAKGKVGKKEVKAKAETKTAA